MSACDVNTRLVVNEGKGKNISVYRSVVQPWKVGITELRGRREKGKPLGLALLTKVSAANLLSRRCRNPLCMYAHHTYHFEPCLSLLSLSVWLELEIIAILSNIMYLFPSHTRTSGSAAVLPSRLWHLSVNASQQQQEPEPQQREPREAEQQEIERHSLRLLFCQWPCC